MSARKTRFLPPRQIVEKFPMDLSTLEKKRTLDSGRVPGRIRAIPDESKPRCFLYSEADAEHEAPPTDPRTKWIVERGKKYLWIQCAPKQLNASVDTIRRWASEGKVRIVRREFSGTRGVRLFIDPEEVRNAQRGDEVPAGHILLATAVEQSGKHEATLRRLIHEGIIDGCRIRQQSKKKPGRMVAVYAVNERDFEGWMKRRSKRPDPRIYVEAKEAAAELGVTVSTLARWATEGCPYLNDQNIRRDAREALREHDRSMEMWFYRRKEIDQIKEILLAGASRRWRASNGQWFLAWDLAAKRARVHPIRLWSWSQGEVCDYLPGPGLLKSHDMPIVPHRPTAKEENGDTKLSVRGYDAEQIEIIRSRGQLSEDAARRSADEQLQIAKQTLDLARGIDKTTSATLSKVSDRAELPLVHHNGPGQNYSFWWEGRSTTLQPKDWTVLDYVWKQSPRAAEIESILDAINDSASDKAMTNRVGRIATALSKVECNLQIRKKAGSIIID